MFSHSVKMLTCTALLIAAMIGDSITSYAHAQLMNFGHSIATGSGQFRTTSKSSFDEFAVGAPVALTSAGVVAVYFRSSSTWQKAYVYQDKIPGTGDSSEPGDLFGYSVATGDFDGDGYKDLAIGVPFEDINGLSNAGCVHVLYGTNSGGLPGLPFRSESVYLTRADAWNETEVSNQLQSWDRFGHSLAVGDFNNDGWDDLAIGAPGVDVGGENAAGAVFVFKSGGTYFPRVGEYTMFQGGPHSNEGTAVAGENFGHALAAGDFNGDGADGLAVSSPWETVGGDSNAGKVTVLYGQSSGGSPLSPNTNRVITQDSHGIGTTSEPNDYFGEALAVGNFDNQVGVGQLYDDLAIGTPREDWSSTIDVGHVQIMYGSPSGPVTTREQFFLASSFPGISVEANANFGASLAAGDVINDPNGGCGSQLCNPVELIIGEPNRTWVENPFGSITHTSSGQVYVLRGTSGGLDPNHNQPVWPGPRDDFAYYGWAVAAGKYVTHEQDPGSIPDVIAGIPGIDEVQVNLGGTNTIRGIEFQITPP